MIPPHTKAIPLNRLPVVRKHGEALFCPGGAGTMRYPSNQGGALPRFARPAARCRPSQTRHCRRVVRLGANTLHGASAACPKRRVRHRTRPRPPRTRLPAPPHRPEKKRDPNKNLPGAGESTPRNVPRGTFRRPAILQKQCSTWNILSKIRSAPPRNSHYI